MTRFLKTGLAAALLAGAFTATPVLAQAEGEPAEAYVRYDDLDLSTDAAPEVDLFFESKKLRAQGFTVESNSKLKEYLQKNPSGQFADQASMILGDYESEFLNFEAFILNLRSVGSINLTKEITHKNGRIMDDKIPC